MGLFKNILGKKDESIESNQDFWDWFQENEKAFHKIIKNQDNIEEEFFNKLAPILDKLREGYWFLAGMYDDDTAELVLTVDGMIKNIAFVEELVQSAPVIKGWRFTALKPESMIENVVINMGDLTFSKDNMAFYSNDNPQYPDEIDITVVHESYNESISAPITNGTYIFMDNYLGELNSVTTIDNMQVIGSDQAEKELIPIEKLKDFLIWRQKEFIEKYEGTRYNTENDSYQSLEGTLSNDMPLIATINSSLLNWESKASHPWILIIEIKYQGNENGMPDKESYDLMNDFEDELILELKDSDGYLNVGRQTADDLREIYFACKDFRSSSKVVNAFQKKYSDRLDMTYDIYKDKYWRSMDRFRPEI